MNLSEYPARPSTKKCRNTGSTSTGSHPTTTGNDACTFTCAGFHTLLDVKCHRIHPFETGFPGKFRQRRICSLSLPANAPPIRNLQRGVHSRKNCPGRKNMMKTLFAGLAAAAAFSLAPLSATAADDTARTITLVVPFSPGGPTDTATRPVADAQPQQHGHQAVAAKRSAGSGAVGA